MRLIHKFIYEIIYAIRILSYPIRTIFRHADLPQA